jgi:hypothetical protein
MADRTIIGITTALVILIVILFILIVIAAYLNRRDNPDGPPDPHSPNARQLTYPGSQITQLGYDGAVQVGNNIYVAPNGSNSIMIVNATTYDVSYVSMGNIFTTSNTTTTMRGCNTTTTSNQSCNTTAAPIERYSGCAATSSNVYFAPYTTTYILVYNICGGSLTRFDWSNLVDGVDETDHSFRGVIRNNGKLFFIPYGYPRVMIHDISSGKNRVINTPLTTSNTGVSDHFYSRGVLRGNTIYCMPDHANFIMKINTSNDSISFINRDISNDVTSTPRYYGGAINTSNTIYAAPSTSDQVMTIGSGDSISFINTSMTSINKSQTRSMFYRGGAVLPADGAVYFAPYHAQYAIGVLSNGDVVRAAGEVHPPNQPQTIDPSYTDAFSIGNNRILYIPDQANQLCLMTYNP